MLVTIRFFASRKEGTAGGGGSGVGRTRLLTTEYSTSRTCQARFTSWGPGLPARLELVSLGDCYPGIPEVCLFPAARSLVASLGFATLRLRAL